MNEQLNSLTSVSTVFCDTLEALRRAQSVGLSCDATILTISPAVLKALPERARNLESRLVPSVHAHFDGGAYAFEQGVYTTLLRSGLEKPMALLLVRLVSAQQRVMLLGAVIEHDDLAAPRALVVAETGSARKDARFNGPWLSLLASNSALRVLRFPVSVTAERDMAGGQPPPFNERLRFASLPSLMYRLATRLPQLVKALMPRGRIAVLAEGELLKETCCYLGLRGFALERLTAKPRADRLDPHSHQFGSDAAVLEPLDAILEAHLDGWVLPQVAAVIKHNCLQLLSDAMRDYHAAHLWWETRIPSRTAAVVTTYPAGPAQLALAQRCNERGIPFVSFQHGMGREISAEYERRGVHLEPSASSHFMAFSRKSGQVSAHATRGWHVLDECVVHPVGYSQEHHSVAAAESSERSVGAPLLYVSTAVYRGYVASRLDAKTDEAMAREESAFIDNVLKGLPHEVAFKPYPALRYSDPDPVLSVVRATPNLRLVGEHTDLRYMIRRHRVQIVMRATSTVAWCLFSARPLVYINTDDWYRLRGDLVGLFADGTFYFDAAEPGWMERVRELLCLPVADIEAQWASKSAGRDRLMKFVDDMGKGSGKRAATAVYEAICQN